MIFLFFSAAFSADSFTLAPFFRVKVARVPLMKMRSMSSPMVLSMAARTFLPALQPLPVASRVQTVILLVLASFFLSWASFLAPSSPLAFSP